MPKIINIKGDIIPNDNAWIYDWFAWDYTCPKDVITILNDVNGTEDIIIKIASGGGSVAAAHEIYTELAGYKGNIEAHVVSLAGSAASEILMAVKSKISPVGLVMIHNCATSASGDYREMDSASNMLKEINKSIRNAYKAKTGMSDEDLSKYMDDVTWLGAEQAVQLGFVDEIMELGSDSSNNVPSNAIPTFYNSIGLFIDQDKVKALKAVIGSMPENNKLANQKNTITDSQAFIHNTQTFKGGHSMTLEEVMNQYPDIANEIDTIKVAARQEGQIKERNRMQEIDSVSAVIPEDMIANAKFTNPCTASELTFQYLQNSAKQEKAYIQDAINDSKSSGVENIKPDPVTELSGNNQDADDILADVAAKAANKNRRGGK